MHCEIYTPYASIAASQVVMAAVKPSKGLRRIVHHEPVHFASVASLLAAHLHQPTPERNHKLYSTVSTEKNILHMVVM